MDPEKKKLVDKNVPLARYLARIAWERNKNQMELDEVTSHAYIGLMKAADKWHPEGREIKPEDLASGKAFAGWARKWIVGEILEWQRSTDHVQRSYRRIYKQLVSLGHGAGKTQPELVELTGLKPEKIRDVIWSVESSMIYLDAPQVNDSYQDGQTVTNADRHGSLISSHAVESSAMERTIMSATSKAISELPDLQQVVVSLRYLGGLELQVIAAELQMGLSAIREANTEATATIHAAMLHTVIEPD